MTDLLDTAVRWTEQDAVDFERTLTPESLSAVMRATWTWDDRALRRDLSQLLVDLAAARAVEVTLPRALADAVPVHRVMRGRNLARAARFLSHVLGPRMIADTGQSNTFDLAEAVLAAPSLRLLSGAERTALLAVSDHVLRQAAPAVGAGDFPSAADPGTAVPVAFGGAGGGPCEVGVAAEALGAAPSPSTFLATGVLAVYALLACRAANTGADVDGRAGLLRAIASGGVTATLAAAERGGSWDPALVRCRATQAGDGWTINGHKSFVPDAGAADVLLVVARTTGGPTLFQVAAGAPGLETAAMTVLDPTRPLGELHLLDTPATPVGAEGAAGALMARVLDLATLAVAAEQVGLAQRCLDIVVEHLAGGEADASERLAVAEMYLQVTSARAIASDAAEQAAGGGPDAAAAAARAHIRCSQAAVTVVGRARAVVGERAAQGHPLLALHRRAVASELLFGGPAVSHERLLERLGI